MPAKEKQNKIIEVVDLKTKKIIFFLFPVILLIPTINVRAQVFTDISVQTAYDMINNNTQYPNLIILDVRDQWEYDENHLCDAILIPVSEIDTRINELEPYKDIEIVVYCMSGGRSAIASQNLVDNHNFTKIYNMLGGITAWIAEGYPVCGQPSIAFEMITFSLILLSTTSLIVLFYKKKTQQIRT
ncbi:MAG: rhodanese-like domain-containing protein [Candidatus Hermodarchaeota archaeon]